ncbi:MAG: ATP-dependent helicase HrpB [Brevundimonas sp.]|uniref:ATP-dependent helicase HrpB n=1 Tax=Brevundimonas sp. TaxID=1871086 RepID=UPI003919FFDB
MPADRETLPVEAVIGEVLAALEQSGAAVLIAPPGAGKTTRVPLALLEQAAWCTGRVLVLEPRRLAARAAAARMADTLGEAVGERVGYRVRMDARVSARTRIEVVTEGVFTRMILDDPALEGVSAVLFDEFHERSLDADLGLAFAWESRALLREDLRVLVMSATLDGGRVSAALGGVPVIVSEGRVWPVETRYPGPPGDLRLEDAMSRAILTALSEEEGSVLAFLPGQGEIERTARTLEERLAAQPDVLIAPLYGVMDRRDQDRALSPAPPGQRKVVLATAIAETSLTIEGVRIVVDSGLSRISRFDPGTGVSRLVTVPVSQASADQRRGRAGRTGPGVCYRLWDEARTRGLVPQHPPEILATDLTALALDLARWGAGDPADLTLLDQPPAGAYAEAKARLARMNALDDGGRLTAHGRAMGELPLPPHLAHMVLTSEDAATACELAVLIGERGLGGSDTDAETRLSRFRAERSRRAGDARALARSLLARSGRAGHATASESVGMMLARAWPERVARRKGPGGDYLMVSGRGASLDPTDALARSDWLAIAELSSAGARDTIRLAAAISEAEVLALLDARIETREALIEDGQGRLSVREQRRLGAITLGERLVRSPPPAMIEAALLAQFRAEGMKVLPLGSESHALLARLNWLHASDEAWPDMSEPALLRDAETWLAPLLSGVRGWRSLTDNQIARALASRIPWDKQRLFDAEAPSHFISPGGHRVPIDYGAEGGPSIAVRVQELYGLASHPVIGARRTPLVLVLLSPARRPVQVTRDLPGFWRGSWAEVRAQMRGRYPKHRWPENPLDPDR